MDRKLLMAGFSGAALLAACSAPPSQKTAQPQAASPRATLSVPAAPALLVPPLTLEGYKKAFAQQVARGSPEVFTEPVPEMLKSVVVLEVTIGSDGRLLRVAVRRSNGYKALENLALESVRRAAPFTAPAWTIRRSDGTVNFLETFLFRDDGRYRIRSLVASR